MSSPAAPEPRRIIVVDDDEGMRVLLRVTIELDERFELAASAANAHELRELLDARDGSLQVDAIVLDHTLPDTDGVELIGELRGRLPDAMLVLYTGWADPEVERRAREHGASLVISKALDPRELFNEVVVSS